MHCLRCGSQWLRIAKLIDSTKWQLGSYIETPNIKGVANVPVGERKELKLPNKNSQALRLRAHHICCIRFWTAPAEERGPDYLQARNKIVSVLLSQPESVVTVVEGTDDLCKFCIRCVDERCSSPRGNEDQVRKWDAILLKEVGLPFGSCLTSGKWQTLIEQKTPFRLCQKCQWKKICSVGASLL